MILFFKLPKKKNSSRNRFQRSIHALSIELKSFHIINFCWNMHFYMQYIILGMAEVRQASIILEFHKVGVYYFLKQKSLSIKIITNSLHDKYKCFLKVGHLIINARVCTMSPLYFKNHSTCSSETLHVGWDWLSSGFESVSKLISSPTGLLGPQAGFY